MPRPPGWYVNGMNETLEDSIRRMKRFNARYNREMHTLFQAEEAFRRTNWEAMSVRDKKQMVRRAIGHRVDDMGKIHILCKDGKTRRYDADKWSETMARTRSRALQEEGLHNEMARHGLDLVMVSVGGSGDPCRFWEGKVLSIAGKTPGYQTVAAARREHIFHPNCVVDGQVPVHTVDGLVPIKEVRVGDLVLTHRRRYKKVASTMTRSALVGEKYVRIRFNGSIRFPSVTGEHPVLTGSGWKRAVDVEPGDKVYVLHDHDCPQCGRPVFVGHEFCGLSCKSRYHIIRNTTAGRYDDARKKHSRTMKRLYRSGAITAATEKAHEATRALVREGRHPFQRPDNHLKAARALGSRGKTSFIERKICWLLEQKGMSFEAQYCFNRRVSFKNGQPRRYFIDVAIPEYRIAIECDGAYWHANTDEDAKRQQEIEDAGWTVVRFSEKQIRNDLQSCGRVIDRLLRNHRREYRLMAIPVRAVEVRELRRNRKVYNLSVVEDESYLIGKCGWAVHNCVHSTSPFIVGGGEEQEIIGRDDLPDAAREQFLGNPDLLPRATVALNRLGAVVHEATRDEFTGLRELLRESDSLSGVRLDEDALELRVGGGFDPSDSNMRSLIREANRHDIRVRFPEGDTGRLLQARMLRVLDEPFASKGFSGPGYVADIRKVSRHHFASGVTRDSYAAFAHDYAALLDRYRQFGVPPTMVSRMQAGRVMEYSERAAQRYRWSTTVKGIDSLRMTRVRLEPRAFFSQNSDDVIREVLGAGLDPKHAMTEVRFTVPPSDAYHVANLNRHLSELGYLPDMRHSDTLARINTGDKRFARRALRDWDAKNKKYRLLYKRLGIEGAFDKLIDPEMSLLRGEIESAVDSLLNARTVAAKGLSEGMVTPWMSRAEANRLCPVRDAQKVVDLGTNRPSSGQAALVWDDIRSWKGSSTGYRMQERFLLGDRSYTGGDRGQFFDEGIRRLNAFVANGPKYRGMISRGIETRGELARRLKVGDIWEEWSLSSYSHGASPAFGSMDTILRVPKSTRGVNIQHVTPLHHGEREVLYPRTRLRVKKIESYSGQDYITFEEV